MVSNNTHSPNTESESRPSGDKDAAPFFLRCVACQSIRGNRTSTPHTRARVHPHWYPVGKSRTGEPHHSDSRQGDGTKLGDRRAMDNRFGSFGDYQKRSRNL